MYERKFFIYSFREDDEIMLKKLCLVLILNRSFRSLSKDVGQVYQGIEMSLSLCD